MKLLMANPLMMLMSATTTISSAKEKPGCALRAPAKGWWNESGACLNSNRAS